MLQPIMFAIRLECALSHLSGAFWRLRQTLDSLGQTLLVARWHHDSTGVIAKRQGDFRARRDLCHDGATARQDAIQLARHRDSLEPGILRDQGAMAGRETLGKFAEGDEVEPIDVG